MHGAPNCVAQLWQIDPAMHDSGEDAVQADQLTPSSQQFVVHVTKTPNTPSVPSTDCQPTLLETGSSWAQSCARRANSMHNTLHPMEAAVSLARRRYVWAVNPHAVPLEHVAGGAQAPGGTHHAEPGR